MNVTKQQQVKAPRIRVGELSEVGATLTVEELNAISGARPAEGRGSWRSGASHGIDEWTIN
ncbi:MAG TPA: hypothetical protein VEN28_08470 [Burkholderiaceae bacterium]|jgi:hypothetical protein|nr:hypothetical protein [Burkholderiaceae bacterium]